MKKIITTLIILFCTNIAFSQKYTIGLGLSKCTTFYKATIDEKIIYMSWAAGYITSQNIINSKLHARDISYDTSIIWLEYFCHNNPQKSFKEAVESYINKFSK